MSDSGDGSKYKWTPESTALLVSVWTDKQVQKQLEYATKPQLIWESVARYMQKKGYSVSGKQCRSRMKQVLVCYREAKKAGTRAGVEQYYESIDRVLKNRRVQQSNINVGVDTVDSSANVKSPPKDVKTNKNLQMRYQYREPIESLLRTEALSPTWELAHDEEYPDSPESNETVLAQPYRAFSPVRDAATNTVHQLTPIVRKSFRQNSHPVKDSPIQQTYRQNSLPNNRFSEVPLQNSVQNVQNHIIQENMQQNHAMLQQNLLQAQSQLLQQNLLQANPMLQQNLLHNTNQVLQGQLQPQMLNHNRVPQNVLRAQNQLQQSAAINNQAMPQEPRKATFRQNLAATYKQYQEAVPSQNFNPIVNQIGQLSPDYSSDVAPNLNDAFCQTPKSEKSQNLNETFNQQLPAYNPLLLPSLDVTSLTTNATYNDDTLSIEFLQDSPSPSDNGIGKMKDFAVNTENIPDAPFRKKKAQKLEQLMISAISSQNEVVNKILAAQTDMVTRFLDVDRDRQNRLENRLDHLLTVVHASVLNKTPEKESEFSNPLPEQRITGLVPPPKPGSIPPKLDLVPPKPCRVPCTVPNSKVELVNQNNLSTRPGVVTPVTSPSGKMGPIWSKLGPASQSPFVRAQVQLGFLPMFNTESRTQSSAERRIAQQVGQSMDTKTLIFETVTFLETERRLEEKIENARRQDKMGHELTIRKKLFTQREPNAAMILTTAFLEAERQNEEICETARMLWNRNRTTQMRSEFLDRLAYNSDGLALNEKKDDGLITGQGESYERLRQLKSQARYHNEPIDSSTPAKPERQPKTEAFAPNRYASDVERRVNFGNDQPVETKQTIQQLGQLVMNSARWRNTAAQNQQHNTFGANTVERIAGGNINTDRNVPVDQGQSNGRNLNAYSQFGNNQQDNKLQPATFGQERYSYGGQPTLNRLAEQKNGNTARLSYNGPLTSSERQMGFTMNKLNVGDTEEKMGRFGNQMGFVDNSAQMGYRQQNPFEQQLQRAYAQQNHPQRERNQRPPFMTGNGQVIRAQNHNMIQQYMQEIKPQRLGMEAKDTDSDNDEEFLDTTMSMQPTSSSRRGSLTSTGTATTATSTKSSKVDGANCIIS